MAICIDANEGFTEQAFYCLNLAEPMSPSIIYPFVAQVSYFIDSYYSDLTIYQLMEELGVAQKMSSVGYYVGMMVHSLL